MSSDTSEHLGAPWDTDYFRLLSLSSDVFSLILGAPFSYRKSWRKVEVSPKSECHCREFFNLPAARHDRIDVVSDSIYQFYRYSRPQVNVQSEQQWKVVNHLLLTIGSNNKCSIIIINCCVKINLIITTPEIKKKMNNKLNIH